MARRLLRYALDVAGKDALIWAGAKCGRCLNSPYRVILSVTDSCNARCITCDRWRNTTAAEELTEDEWKTLVGDIVGWIGPCHLSFTGGEPTIKPWIYDLVSYAHGLGAYCDISTNGLALVGRECDRLIGSGADFVLFSLNSMDPAIHDRYKGVSGSHERAVSAIKYLAEKGGIAIGVTFMVTCENYGQMADFAKWVSGAGAASVDYQAIRDNFGPNFSPRPSMTASKTNPLWGTVDAARLVAEVDRLIEAKRAGAPVVTSDRELLNFKRYFRDPQTVERRRKCRIGWGGAIVSSYGDVKLCYSTPTVGNVRRKSIRDIWESDEAGRVRQGMLECAIPCMSACLRDNSLRDKYAMFMARSSAKPRKAAK